MFLLQMKHIFLQYFLLYLSTLLILPPFSKENCGIYKMNEWRLSMHYINAHKHAKNLIQRHIYLLSICTGILGTFDILQFEISSLMNWIFFLVWKQTGYFYQFKLYFFPSFWARVKYFDGPCSTIHSLFTIYRDIH